MHWPDRSGSAHGILLPLGSGWWHPGTCHSPAQRIFTNLYSAPFISILAEELHQGHHSFKSRVPGVLHTAFFFFFRWRRGKENEITVWWCSWVQVKPGAFDGAASRDSQSLIDCVWKTIVLPRCQALCRRLRALTLAGGERIYSNN